jgi:beta-phosphoglucomutase-like phosphatase (HAD superfamily)
VDVNYLLAHAPVIQAVLFDLDGTLADTAPGHGAHVNEMRSRRGLEPVAESVVRPSSRRERAE